MKMFYFGLILLILVGIYSFVEPHFLGVEKVEIETEKIEDLKIAHLTDFHSRHFGKIEKRVLAKLKEIEPDYIFITGDFVDARTHDLESCQDFWTALAEQYPDRVYGVTGNHEYRHPENDEITSRLRESGIKLLNNESVELEGFVLAGVESPHLKHDDVERVFDRKVDILLAHSPEIFRKVKDKKVDLVLTGHTHGGQVNIPLLRRLVLPLRYGKKYREGLFHEEGTYMYVNRGIGTTVLPIRFNAPPVIGLITTKQ